MPGISIHVVDVSRGVVAAGMQIELLRADGKVIASGATNAKGLLEHPALGATFERASHTVTLSAAYVEA